MHIAITVRHGDIAAESREYAHRRLEALGQIWPRLTDAHLIIQAERRGYVVEINLNAINAQVSCRARNRDLRAATDQALQKAEKQVIRLKTRFQKRRKREVLPPAAPIELPADVPRLTREENFVLKTLSEREASFHLRASQLHFLVYRDIDTKKICIIYRKSDGNLGLIELTDEK